VSINWNGKRRWIAGLLLLAGIWITINIPPVIPVIQLPGEVYPGRYVFGLPLTNTLVGSAVAWILIGLLIFYVARNRPKDGSEVPRGGFYNVFEMLFEGLYGFIQGVAGGPYLVPIFKMFFTIFIIVILSNWQALIPGVDSVGILEAKLDKKTGQPLEGRGYDAMQSGAFWAINPRCPWVSPAGAASQTAEDIAARVANGCKSGIGAAVEEHAAEGTTTEGGHATEATPAEGTASIEATTTTEGPQAAEGAAATTTEGAAAAEGEHAAAAPAEGAAAEGEHHYTPGDPAVPWVVLPFVRPPSTDLNMTAALALIAVVMVQVMGFRALGPGYLTKFFNFKTLFTSPLGGIDVAVGLLELIGEFAKILSFTFRLLGNVFAGSVLLFVMSFLLPFLPWPFFILEFFVGALQAFVFGLLTAIFMNQATASHHGDDHHEEGGEHAAAH
jgi:F0F1-type ATP synthase membrane subunit a